MKFPSSLRGGVHGLEDAIITLSGPGIALSGIIAGVDLLTGGHAMQGIPWLTTTWAICLLLSLDFQVLALGARAHQVYLSDKPVARKVVEIILALAIAAAISYVSIQMQSIVAKMSASNLSIDQATAALGIDPNALIFERSILVLVLIFLSGWFRHESRSPEQVNQVNGLNQGIQWEQLEEWFGMVVQMNQGMLNQFLGQAKDELLARLAQVELANQEELNQLRQGMVHRLAQSAQMHLDSAQAIEQRLVALEQAQMGQQPADLAVVQDQLGKLLNQYSQGQQRHLETVFSRYVEQVLVREEKPARQFITNPRMRAIPASTSSSTSAPGQTEELATVGVPVQEQLASSEEGSRVLNYLDQCRAAGSPEPSLSQIEQACTVSHNTAIAWRREWRAKQGLLISSGK